MGQRFKNRLALNENGKLSAISSQYDETEENVCLVL